MTKALLPPPPIPAVPASAMIATVARRYKVSPLRQFREMLSLKYRHKKVDFDEYYSQGIYRRDLSRAEKREFIGMTANAALNRRLSPGTRFVIRDTFRDKVASAALYAREGLSHPRIQAVFGPAGAADDTAGHRKLADAPDVADFLSGGAEYPMFGKPAEGSGSAGSAMILACDAGRVTLGNGAEHDLKSFAAEVVADFPGGYLFQDLVEQHPDLSRVAGRALGTVRMVTVNDGSGPVLLYAVWKLPSPDAMSDNFWQEGSMLAPIDVSTGIATGCRRGVGPTAQDIAAHPVSGLAVVGLAMPDWAAARDLAQRAHAAFPEAGCLGWDMGLGAGGPVIIECNTNPFHTLYQIATGRGLMNGDLAPTIRRALGRDNG